tara:strand:+ start:105 stop:278 length:174 start_codon:yes stop_codon:yes gene_type:complete
MKVGDLVKQVGWDGIGIITCIDPEELGDLNEVEVTWSDGVVSNHSAGFLELVSEKAS